MRNLEKKLERITVLVCYESSNDEGVSMTLVKPREKALLKSQKRITVLV